ncbi:MAG TPA: hypothetical protein VF799_04205 [Geobacteraceae bacterium]
MFPIRCRHLILLCAVVTVLAVDAGCARYARNVNALYEPSATARGGSGELYIVMSPGRETPSENVKWVIGTVKDRDGVKIDEIFSPRSPEEIFRSALSQELKKAGYTVQAVTARPTGSVKELDLTKAEIKLDQVSDLADLKANCHMEVRLDISKNGQLLKKLQYESTASDTTINDRDLLAGTVLQEGLRSIMQRAVPDIISILEK